MIVKYSQEYGHIKNATCGLVHDSSRAPAVVCGAYVVKALSPPNQTFVFGAFKLSTGWVKNYCVIIV